MSAAVKPLDASPRLQPLAVGNVQRTLILDDNGPVALGTFLAQVRAVAAALPSGRHAVNLCEDRYRFLVAFCAVALRGQTTLLPPDLTGAPALPRPLADGGYVLQLLDGRLLCGATAQRDDADPVLREADHQHNLATLQRLTGWSPAVDARQLGGRVGWRLLADDRLPLLGPLAAAAHTMARPADQPRLVPRQPGLFVFTALGSRGISQAALGAEVLASWLTGDPVPLPAALLDALDAARFTSRAVRRAARRSVE